MLHERGFSCLQMSIVNMSDTGATRLTLSQPDRDPLRKDLSILMMTLYCPLNKRLPLSEYLRTAIGYHRHIRGHLQRLQSRNWERLDPKTFHFF